MIDIERNRWKVFLTVTSIGFLIDFYSKYIASTNLKFAVPVQIFGDILQLQLVYNKGALFGLNPQSLFPSFPINLFFYIFSTIAIIFLLLYYKSIESYAKLTLWGIALVMPGALGNLFDRLIRADKGVVDFIKMDFHFWPFNPWPNYNMADAFITVGVILIFVDMFIQRNDKKKSGETVTIAQDS